MELGKYSMGVGDRFGFECAAQLRAVQRAAASGIRIVPVWNKSNREHLIAGTVPEDARSAADEAVEKCGWEDSYYVDADHIELKTVDPFIPCSDYYTIDLAEYIGKPASRGSEAGFIAAMKPYRGSLRIPEMQATPELTDSALADFARTYLYAIEEAGKVYRHIASKKGPENFVTEVSADEAQHSQSPVELLLILAALAHERIPVQAIAPKYAGSFLKGIDYVGDPDQFIKEFRDDLAVLAFAAKNFALPQNLKLSIHTGSDKFTLYPLIHRAIKDMNTGIHLKTAGTTWLQEAAGMAASGGAGLDFAKEIYKESFRRCDDLCRPYLAVINIDKNRLPSPAEVDSWSPEEFVQALQHDRSCPRYNLHFRQLLHVGFKVAAEKKARFTEMLLEYRGAIEKNVTRNLYENHIRPLYLGPHSAS